jgi:hypothetical protein
MDSDSEVVGKRMYRSFDVWCLAGKDSLVRYRCFEVIPLGKFCVQSKDSYYKPIDEKAVQQLDFQFLELLFEELPDARSGMFDFVAAAIQAHESEFI